MESEIIKQKAERPDTVERERERESGSLIKYRTNINIFKSLKYINIAKRETGITLITLVVTIILLVIVTSITISSLTGNNGLIDKAEISKEQAKKAQYEEIIQTIGVKLEQPKAMQHWDSEKYMDNYEIEIREHEAFQDAREITRKDPETIEIITIEGFIYIILEEDGIYIGKISSNEELQKDAIEMSAEPTNWTNNGVNVGIISKRENYKLQYSKDANLWQEYTDIIHLKDNGNIFARLVDSKDELIGYDIKRIKNIDKLAPKSFKAMASSVSGGISVTGNVIDAPKTKNDGCSGIGKYYFSQDNGTSWLPVGGQTEATYLFSGVTQAQISNLRMKAVDNAGNETISKDVTLSSDNVPGLDSGNTTFAYNPTKPTKESVEVTITTTVKEDKYILQYSKNGTDWVDYKSPVEMEHNGKIYARVWDGKNGGGYAEGNVENIDRLPPNSFTPTATTTTNSITLTGHTTDAEKTDTDACSGIARYYFSKDNGVTWEPTNGQTQDEISYTFNGVTQNETYKLKMKAVDNAGNEIVTTAIDGKTSSVPGLTTEVGKSNVTFGYNPTEWTQGSVAVTIVTTITGYTLEYSTNGTEWNNYTSSFTVQNNGVIYARLKDSTGQVGGIATGNVTNIDRLAPDDFEPTATSTTNSITLTGSTSDAMATTTDGCSGIDKYYFSKDNGGTWEPSGGQSGTSYTFANLSQGRTYSLKIKAVDKAGNERISSTVLNKSTGEVPTLNTSNTIFTYVPSDWTKEKVDVSIRTTAGSQYTIQYSTDANTWRDYIGAIEFTQNGSIYARVKDSTGQVATGYATGNVENIDKFAPNQFTPTATNTADSITLTGSTTDVARTATNGCSGVDKYYFSKDDGVTWEPTDGQVDTSYTFTGLDSGETYNLRMKAEDKAKNEVVTNVLSVKTSVVPTTTTPDSSVNIVRAYAKIDIIWLEGTSNTITSIPNEPILTSNGETMVPIKWNTLSNAVDTTSTDTSWYDYKGTEGDIVNTESRWANARTANDSYFVWIPRYAYRITYYSNKYYTEETGYYDGYGEWSADTGKLAYELESGVETVEYEGNKYIVHPAFQTDLALGGWSEKLSGFWISKFAMSGITGNELKSTYGQELKPNKRVGAHYELARKATYGYVGNIDTDGNISFMNSHMSKNSEWGALTYLTASKYGTNNIIEVNAVNYNTSYSGGGTGVGYINNVNRTTTGNLYGVYDTCLAIRMACWDNEGNVGKGQTFEVFASYGGTSTKYATAYSNGTSYSLMYRQPQTYNIGKTGDGTKEIPSGWLLGGTEYGNLPRYSDPFGYRQNLVTPRATSGAEDWCVSGKTYRYYNIMTVLCPSIE